MTEQIKKKSKCTICHNEGHNKRRCLSEQSVPQQQELQEEQEQQSPKVIPPPSKSKHQITQDDAEKSASEWTGTSDSHAKKWLTSAIMDPTKHRDIGKFLSPLAEEYINNWLSNVSGRSVQGVVGKSYDSITVDDKPIVRNQIKFRMGAWHFETTRRNSKKNENTNSTGHVAYKNDEFDMVVIFSPSKTFGISGSSVRCIPTSALINPHKPDQLVTSISMSIRKKYDTSEMAQEVIMNLYNPIQPSSNTSFASGLISNNI
jgi:hypothetical protein